MRAVVTGGAGFIGSKLVESLRHDGSDVLVVDNLAAGDRRVPFLERVGARLEPIDITDPSLAAVIGQYRPDVIFHLAAQIDVRVSVADPVVDATINIAGALAVLEAAREVGARFVFTSSGGCIYGEAEEPPVDESATGRPTSPYGISKKVIADYLHFYALTYGLRSVVLALANVYGPGQDPSGESGVVAIFAGRLLSGEPCYIYGDGSATRDYVYVSDVVDAVKTAATLGDGELFNIGTGAETSVASLHGLMMGIIGSDLEPIYADARPGELQRSALDHGKATKILGWAPKVTLEEGLRLTIDSFR